MKTTSDLLGHVNLVAFCVLAVACFRKRRETNMGWAVVAFGSLATIGIIGLALEQPATRGLAGWLVKGLLVVVLLFPYFLYRFAVGFERPTRIASLTAHVSTAVVVIWTFLIPYFPMPGMPEPSWWTGYRAAIMIQWTILFTIVEMRLWFAARHEATVPRLRMRTLALATVGMNCSILLSGVAPVPKSLLLLLVTKVTWLLASGLFFIGLVPPSWLLFVWRRRESMEFQSAMGGLFQAETQGELSAVLLPRTVGLVGARGAALVSASGEILGRHGSTDSHEDVVRLMTSSAAEEVAGLHRVDFRNGTLFIWMSPYAPFFSRDELAMTEALGVFADLVMERFALADQQKQVQAALAHQAVHDSLTGLPNRSLFLDRLHQAVARMERARGVLTVQFLDLDRFKVVNDAIDHAAGDALLVAVAKRLTGAIRAEDTVARFGGDEFVILAELGDEREALALAGRVMTALTAPFCVAHRELSVTASIGVVVTDVGREPGLLVRDADTAMYRAKDAGRARIELFNEAMRRRDVERLEMERVLHHSVDEHELRLHYQPTVRLSDGAIIGAEALVRWEHPTLGLVGPAAFIPIAEDSDLITMIGTWVLHEACRQAAHWRRSVPGLEDFVMWANVSGAQFSRMDVPGMVASALEAARLEPSALGLEITETVFIDQTKHLRAAFEELRQLGVKVAIDDFGTGFSSLGSLKRFPADVLKIDGSFVKGLGRDREDSAIVAACVALAETLGLSAIAEAVETAEQRDALLAMGCLYGQGYLFCKPLPAEGAEAYLRGRAAATPSELRSVPSQARRPPLAIVCDDEPSARRLYHAALESEGAKVESVSGAAECVAWAVEHRPDLALVDLRMPGKDGLWTIAELRRRCPDTRLVLMSADPDSDRFRHGCDLGADDCIAKDDVLARLADLVAGASLERPPGAA